MTPFPALLPRATEPPYVITAETILGPAIFVGSHSTICPLRERPDLSAKIYRFLPSIELDTNKQTPGPFTYAQEDVPDWAAFAHENTSLARLKHPHIISAHAHGTITTKDRTYPYIILETLTGKTLEQIIPKQTQAAPEQLIPLAKDICSALNHTHSQKLIHRDVKPSNVFLTDAGTTKLIDFGLALPYGKKIPEGRDKDIVFGTPLYMSPEQALGYTLDPRTDIYSLGIVLFYAATGDYPFDDDNVNNIILKHLKEPLPDPLIANPKIPPSLAIVIKRATQKLPTKRYQTMADVISDLESAQNEVQRA